MLVLNEQQTVSLFKSFFFFFVRSDFVIVYSGDCLERVEILFLQWEPVGLIPQAGFGQAFICANSRAMLAWHQLGLGTKKKCE